jgi:hypothetical protein
MEPKEALLALRKTHRLSQDAMAEKLLFTVWGGLQKEAATR